MARDDQRVVFLARDAAEELLDLVDDRPGEADEALLDAALDAIEGAAPQLPGDAQQAIARGEAVAVGLDPRETETVATLIREDTETDRRTLRAVGASIKAKLRAAAKKARRRRR